MPNGGIAWLSYLRPETRQMRKRLADMGRMFQRELGLDFPMCSEGETEGEPFLVVDSAGRAIGGFSVWPNAYTNIKEKWRLAWIWIVPIERHRGICVVCGCS